MIYIVSDNSFFYEDFLEIFVNNVKIVKHISTSSIKEDDIVILTSVFDGCSGDICSGVINHNKSLPCGDTRTILITGAYINPDVEILKDRIKVFSKATVYVDAIVKYIEELKGK